MWYKVSKPWTILNKVAILLLMGLTVLGCEAPPISIQVVDAGLDPEGNTEFVPLGFETAESPLEADEDPYGPNCWNPNRRFATEGSVVARPDLAPGAVVPFIEGCSDGNGRDVAPNIQVFVAHLAPTCHADCGVISGDSNWVLSPAGCTQLEVFAAILYVTGLDDNQVVADFVGAANVCVNGNGLTGVAGPAGIEVTWPEMNADQLQEYLRVKYTFQYCLMAAVDALNEHEGSGDNDDDGVDNTCDNCAESANPGQVDSDENGRGDACNPPFADETPFVRGGNGFRWENLYVSDFSTLIDEPLDLVQNRMENEQLGDGLRDGFDGAAPCGGEVPGAMCPGGGQRRIDDPDWVDVALQRVGIIEEQAGAVVDLVHGINYEDWAMDNYCHDIAHEQYGVPCEREVRVKRYDRNFDNPQQLFTPRADGSRIARFRRHDCHCVAVEGVLPPLSLEAKATTRPNHLRYSPTYERHLLEQCRDYRFLLAKLYREAFPEVGDLRTAYETLLRVGMNSPEDDPGVYARKRPILEYRLSVASPALRRVMEMCNFRDQFATDEGLMAQEGAWRSEITGQMLFSAAERLAHQPELPVSMMRWFESTPGALRRPDAVANCQGEIVYLASMSNLRDTNADGVVDTVDPPRLNTICIHDPAAPDWRDRDPLVLQPLPPVLPESNPPMYGELAVPIIAAPVCPPEVINQYGQQLQAQMIDNDGIQHFTEPDAIVDFMRAYLDLFIEFGKPFRIPTARSPAKIDFVKPGYWVALDDVTFFDKFETDPLLMIEWVDGNGQVHQDFADTDERRDLCND